MTVCSVLTGKVSTRSDLASLRRVSKHWRDVTSPIFLECLSVEVDEGWMMHRDEERPYQLPEKMSFGFLQVVRHFKLFAVFHSHLDGRCLHNIHYPNYPTEDQDNEDSHCVRVLGDELRPLLTRLKPNALRSFWCVDRLAVAHAMLTATSWDLGSCIPEDILGTSGYLQREQTHLESLSLNTGAPTDTNGYSYPPDLPLENQPPPLELDAFRHLRRLSWTGILLAPELESLQVFLAANKEILEMLELDFVDWSLVNRACEVELADDDPLAFTKHILPLSENPSTNAFPALTTLLLSVVCLPTNPDATVSAFDFSQLRSLRLHRCLNTHLLLRAILQGALSLKLESFDCVMDDFAEKFERGGSILNAFLRSFSSLRQLYLMIAPLGEITTEQYFESIAYHAASLKRLVYHEVTPETDISSGRDKFLAFETPNLSCGSTGAMTRLMQNASLESLGCCDSLAQLRRTLESDMSTRHLKFLHIRRSKHNVDLSLRNHIVLWTVKGEFESVGMDTSEDPMLKYELFDFARWAFGPRGISTLQFLAFGDFSYDGRHKDRCLLFYRQRIGSINGFRLASRDNVIEFSGIDKPFDFLSTCPTERLYPR